MFDTDMGGRDISSRMETSYYSSYIQKKTNWTPTITGVSAYSVITAKSCANEQLKSVIDDLGYLVQKKIVSFNRNQ